MVMVPEVSYVVYLTVYKGNKLPPFYIGSAIEKNIKEHGYKGSPSSFEYKKVWKLEIKNNPHLFKTYIISKCDSQEEALRREQDIHKRFNVHKSTLYINKSIASLGGFDYTAGRKLTTEERLNKFNSKARENMRKSSQKRWLDIKQRIKVGNDHRGKIESAATRLKKSESAKKRKWSTEVKLKMSISAKIKWARKKEFKNVCA